MFVGIRPSVVPSLIAGTLISVILASLLSAVVVPRANEAYRSLVFETLERRAGVYAPASPVEPARGASEMTWWELREQMAHATDSAGRSRARVRLQERLAFVGLVPILALLGYGLSNRGSSRRAMFAVALAVQTLYYACFSLGLTSFAKLYVPGPGIVNLAFLILALLVLRPSSTPRSHSDA